MSYVTYFRETDYVVCDIIKIAAAGVTDIYFGHKTIFT